MVVHGSRQPNGCSNSGFNILNSNIMKFKAIISILLFSLLTTTCKKETDPATIPQTGSKISFTGQDESAGLKSTTLSGLNVNWAANDRIGIYCAQATSFGTNTLYAAATAGAKSSFTRGKMTWGSGTHYFYAYYPYFGGPNPQAASNLVPISLSATQTQSGNTSTHIGPLDFTVATATASPGTSGQLVNVDLSFKHVFTLLEFDLQLASGGSATTLSSIELYSTDANLSLTSGTIDLTQTPATDVPYTIGSSPAGTKNVILNVSGCTLTSGSVTKAYMMILPGSRLSASGMSIQVISDAGEAIIVKTGINFVRGKRYTIDLTALTLTPITDANGKSYNTVINPTTGKTWLDRNLGATRVATVTNDYLAYGDLYQWGRAADGHQVINWTSSQAGTPSQTTTFTLSTTDTPLNALFIENTQTPWDWRSGQNVNLWQGVNASNNNPCPSGFRLPTSAELEAERASWTIQGSVGAFASPLKLPAAGHRSSDRGLLINVGSCGYYWSSSINGTSSSNLDFSYGFDQKNVYTRTQGFSVRCIKN